MAAAAAAAATAAAPVAAATVAATVASAATAATAAAVAAAASAAAAAVAAALPRLPLPLLWLLALLLQHRRALIESGLAAELKRTAVAPEDTVADGRTGGAAHGNWWLAGQMLRSTPVVAICIAHTTSDWAGYIMYDGTPAYMRDVLGLNLSQAGFFGSSRTPAIDYMYCSVDSWVLFILGC